MAVSTQSRKSARSATQNSAETLESPSPREACLSVRLWSAPTDSGQAQSLWDNGNPAAFLTLDLIATSGGLPTARHEEVLVASFPTFLSAAITARRLQWAVQGYAESEEPRATSLALLIHSAEEGAGETVAEDAFHSLGQAAPGAILLTEKASQPFDRLPGFPLQVASGDGLWELAWSSPDGHNSRPEDEEFLSRIAAEHGVQEPPPPQPAPPPAPEAAAAEEYRTGSYRTGSYRTGSYRQPSEEEPRGSSKIWIGAVALAAVAVIGVAIYLFSGKSNPAPAQNAPQTAALTQPQTDSGSTAESSAPTAIGSSSAAVQPKHSAAQERAENAQAAKPPKNAPKPVVQQQVQETPAERPRQVEPPAPRPSNNGRCDLEPSQYGGQIDQAWKNLGRGKYDTAKRQFSAVLACDPGNGRAKEGLERDRAAAQTEGGSEN
jgi:hypothetical protein